MNYRMPFGKYRGEKICDVPLDYLWWTVANLNRMSPGMRAAVDAEIRRRGVNPEPFTEEELRPKQAAQPLPLDKATAAVSRVRREMSAKHHPDRGGDPKTMGIINDVLDKVLKALKDQ